MSNQVIILSLNHPGERLDKALAQELPQFSRTQCQRLIQQGNILIGGQPVKPGLRLSGDEQVKIIVPPSEEVELTPESIPLDIRYEDDDLILINKSASMVVHPSAGHEKRTLVNAVLGHCPNIKGVGGEKRPGIVHRLDKDTSGLILVAKSDQALRYLQDQFRKREVIKVYQALVDGRFSQKHALIDAPIGRDISDRKRMAVIPPGSAANSRPARTMVNVINYYVGYGGEFTLIECLPKTGRTHQIRVHLAFSGFPIVGDKMYGLRRQRLELDRHFLHATKLTFKRPSDGVEITETAPLPLELQEILSSISCQ